MRVLHLVASPTLTGAAEPALDLVQGLRSLGVQADLRVDTLRSGNLRGILETRGIHAPADLFLSTKAGPVQTVRDLLALPTLLASYTLVHTHLSHDHTLAALARPAVPGLKLVRTVHAERALSAGLGRGWVLRQADGVTVACEDHRRRAVRAHGLEPGRVLRLPGSVDPARFFVDEGARRRVRAALGVDDGTFLVGCVARFQAGRRHELLMDAVALARRGAPGLKLALIGHGETEAALRARAGAPDLWDTVLFCGYRRDDLNDFLNALDVAVWLVNGNDATARAVLQAMAAGRAVVGGAAGAIREAVQPGETGLWVDPDDPADVAAALLALAQAPERARAMGARGAARARAEYGPAARARRALDFYRRLGAAP